MRLRDALADYLNALRYEQGLSPNTVDTYRPRLRAFFDWLAENGCPDPTPGDFTTAACRRYVYHLCGRENRPRTVRACFDALRSFARFLTDAGALTENPTTTIALPKLDAAIRREVTDAEVAALFDACDRQRTLRLVALSRAVLAVMAYGGLRRDEVCNLHVDDVNLTDGSVLVRSGKGRKSRKVFLCADGVDALRGWLSQREKATRHDYLFSVDVRRRLHHRGLAALMETLKAAARMRDQRTLTPHCLRHWAATNALRNGMNLRDVQAHLGHSSVTVTANYLHANEERLRSVSELTAMRTQKPQEESNVIRLPQHEAERPRLRRIAR
jgi:site-specific recombinase XerD